MKVEEIAENAIKIISGDINKASEEASSFNIEDLREVLANGGSVILKKSDLNSPCNKNALDLISSLRKFGIDVCWEKESDKKERSMTKMSSTPDKQVLEEILSEVIDKETPCIIEPGKICVNCSGRCKTLGF
ncbi:MAG: hypothetical protein N2445_04710 [Acidobacteria bacterium]|nr:hypothetical protein [Acidobacteriota bacterium]